METSGEWHLVSDLPPTVTVTAALALVLTAIFFTWKIHPNFGRNRGPAIYPLIGSLPILLRNKHRIFEWFTDELKKSPTHTIRFGHPAAGVVVNTANPANVEHVLKSRFENYGKGELFCRNLSDLLGNGIFNVDGNSWRLQRKVASHEFSTYSLREFVVTCTQKDLEERLLPILFTASEDGTIMDLQNLFMRFAFDAICQLGFGADPRCLQPSLPVVKFCEAFDTATECSAQRFEKFRFHRKILQVLNIGNEKKLKDSMVVVNDFAMGLIRARRMELQGGGSAAHQHEDLLSRFMRFTDSAEVDNPEKSELEKTVWEDLKSSAGATKKKEVVDVFLRDIIISFVLAGRDTSSAALTWFFWLLSSNPRVEGKIYAEIEDRLWTWKPSPSGKGDEIKTPGSVVNFFTFEELKHLHYLHASLHESLRLYPSIPMDTKVCLTDDVLPDGTRIQKDERITYNVYAMGRMESIWGPDCLEFKPERWLQDGVFVPVSPFKYPVFQAGPRICLGKDMALVQMKLMAASLIYNFTFDVVSNHNPQHKPSLIMSMKYGLPVSVRRRSPL